MDVEGTAACSSGGCSISPPNIYAKIAEAVSADAVSFSLFRKCLGSLAFKKFIFQSIWRKASIWIQRFRFVVISSGLGFG